MSVSLSLSRSVCLACFFLLLCLLTQAEVPVTRIVFDASHRPEMLLRAGIPLDHGRVKKDHWFESQFSTDELQLIQSLGFKTETLSFPLKAQAQASCQASAALQDPQGFVYGSMGGYFTYNEMLAQLDTLHARYPEVISAKMPVSDSINSIEGRPLYYVKISDNPMQDEQEPKMLFTALHHAREPGSLSQLIYFMYYLCENYAEDSLVKSIIKNTELYFIPCVNPDGYIYNQTTNQLGGGMWRKNRRNNGNGTFGIDLNRNYGYNWGYDDVGSSPSSNSATYRGASAFSEPETRAVRNFCIQHHFKIAINNHTYGNLLIYPWGYEASLYTPDSANFVNMASLMTNENHYTFGTGDQTVGYVTNGDSDDWMYGSQTEKPKILSMTPEAGSPDFGFWPPLQEILPFCRSMCHMNLEACKMMLPYLRMVPRSGQVVYQQNFFASYSIYNAGITDSIQGSVAVVPLSSNIAGVGAAVSYQNLTNWTSVQDSIVIQLQPGVSWGDEIRYVLRTNNGYYVHDDTISIRYGQLSSLLNDPCNDLQNWSGSSWGTEAPGNNSPSCLSDSPLGYYADNAESVITLAASISLAQAASAWLAYDISWQIEAGYDYMVTEVSPDNGQTWVALCGKYTHPGNSNQLQGQPLIDGMQMNWVREEMSLDDFVGQDVLVRFRLVSDVAVNFEGVKIDNVNILSRSNSPAGNKQAVAEQNTVRVYPNPAEDYTRLYVSTALVNNSLLRIYQADGRLVNEQSVSSAVLRIDTSLMLPGLYQIMVFGSNGVVGASRLVVSGK